MPTTRLVVKTTKKLAPLVSEVLFAAGAQGIEQRGQREQQLVLYADEPATLSAIWQRTLSVLEAVCAARSLPRASFEAVDDSWKTAWTEHLRPVQLTRRLLLTPQPATASERVIVYRPALAFGDGDHATTRLAARAVEAHYRKQPNGALLDIGSGSGVLSFVALRSGARRALGIDVDRKAVRAATHNAKLNGLAQKCRFIHSSGRVSGNFDLVVVNIELRPLLEVLSRLPAAARRAPRLLVTGFLKSQAHQVSAAVKVAGFTAAARRGAGDWVLLEARRDRSRAAAH
jgi:ribosomal protein L11 methyltransferase